jgi:prepilin-type N-terminal cleavage/methylation domain-containing protein
MTPLRRIRRSRSRSGSERGFTLVEVMIALVLMSMVLLAGGAFMIRTMFSSAALVGRQDAVAIANQQLEKVRAVNPTFDASGISPLVYGRTKSAVAAQWAAAAAAGLDVSGTYTGSGGTSWDNATWDSSLKALTVPLTQTVTPNKQAYTVNTLIGTCVKPLLTNACGKLPLGNELFRVVVQVTWTPSTGSCSGQICSFVASALVDPTQDPVFNTSRKPVANSDTATVASAGSIDIGVIANDSGAFAVNGAVTVISAPAHGSASVYSANNIVKYTSTSGYSGTDTFTYTVTDTSGRASAAATVTVTVTPVGVADAALTSAGASSFTTVVLGNDLGSGLTSPAITGAPSIGIAVVNGNTIRYTPPANASGIAVITYTATDSSAQPYSATLTIRVKPAALLTCLSTLSGTSYTFTSSNFLGTGPFAVALVSTSAGPAPTLSGGQTLSGLVANQVINYTVTDGGGITSDPQTIHVTAGGC